MTTPERIQRKRTKGWKMPPNTVYVGRPTKWGNPFVPSDDTTKARKSAVQAFRRYMKAPQTKLIDEFGPTFPALGMIITREALKKQLQELRGKNLACWCPLYDEHGNRVPCHADVLLELANK